MHAKHHLFLLQVRYVKGLDISGAEIAEAERRLGELLATGMQQMHTTLAGPQLDIFCAYGLQSMRSWASKRHHCCLAT